MDKIKIALIWGHHYDDKPYTTHHTFWEAALRQYPNIEFVRFSWADWQVHMKHEYDLYFFVDFHPSLYKLHDKPFHPRVFYWWDAFHFSFAYPAQVTEMFDRSYFAEFQTVKALQSQGLTNVKWLPPAFFEGCYRPLNVEKTLDYSFIGQPDDTVVRKGFTRKGFVEKLSTESLRGSVEQGIYGDAVNLLYNKSKILFDRTIYNNVGTRVFETIGSGGFVLVNKGKVQSGLDELAIDGHHFVSYDDSYEDFMDKMSYYLKYDNERKKVSDAGYKHFLQNHTYRSRIDVILKDFGYGNG